MFIVLLHANEKMGTTQTREGQTFDIWDEMLQKDFAHQVEHEITNDELRNELRAHEISGSK